VRHGPCPTADVDIFEAPNYAFETSGLCDLGFVSAMCGCRSYFDSCTATGLRSASLRAFEVLEMPLHSLSRSVA
jgi:hypothetical protein